MTENVINVWFVSEIKLPDRPIGFFREGGKKKPVHEKKGVNETDLNISEKGSNAGQKIEVKIDPSMKNYTERAKGTMFWKEGKAYDVQISQHPPYVAVDEMFQDGKNNWHKGRTVFFTQSDDEIQSLENDAVGLYVDKIMDYLDSAGALEKADKNSHNQSLADLKWSNFTQYSKTYDSLNKTAQEQLLIEAGIPKENYEVSTIHDSRGYVGKPYDKLPELTRKSINQILYKVMDAQLHNEAWAH